MSYLVSERQAQKVTARSDGAVLILVALCIALIVGIIGLAIDLNMGLGSSTEQQQLANALATGAMDAYLEDSATLTNAQRLNAAALRAEQIANLGKNRSVFEDLLRDPSLFPQLCLRKSASAPCDREFNPGWATDPDAEAGTIIPGVWYHAAPPASFTCSCGICTCSNYPCFVANDFDSCPDKAINAFQVELKQSSSSPLRTIFLKLLGINSMQTPALSAASVVPRRLAILIDLSPSVAADTHLLDPANTLRDSLPAFKLVHGIRCNGDAPTEDPCGAGYPGCSGIVQSSTLPSSLDGQMRVMWEAINSRPIRDPLATDPTLHYRSDYKCFEISKDGGEDGNNGPAYYLIDTYQNAGLGYYGPEPLASIFRAVKKALDVAQQNAQAGDQIVLIGFDRTILSNRVIPEPSGSSPYRLAPIKAGDTDFDAIKDVVNIEDSATHGARYSAHAFFPRVNPRESNRSDSGVWSNLIWAIKKGVDALSQDEEVYSDLEMVIFSDFLANCVDANPTGDPEDCGSGTRFIEGYGNRTPPDGEWVPYVYSAISQIGWRFNNPGGYLESTKIHFNPIMFGTVPGPHTTLLYDGRGSCLWDENVIRQRCGTKYTNSDSPWPPSPYYFVPNKRYDIALNSGGVWGPIRDCCRDNSGNCMSAEDIQTQLNNYCRNTEYYRQGWLTCHASDGHCALCEAAPDVYGHSIYVDNPETGGEYRDAAGRLLCDPYGRTRLKQMEDYMLQVMGAPSIRLVGPARRLTP